MANAYLQNARKTPEWFTKGVMYQIQPRAFTPEGTLKAAEAKLPYLKDLGVTIVYLVPVMKMDDSMDQSFWSPRQIKSGFNNPKNQYRIADYFHVDSEYGTDDDLVSFCSAAHKLGLKVIFDLVFLHCGPTAPFIYEHPDFTWWNDDGSVRKGPWRFPMLNFANPAVRKYLEDNVRYLISHYGADGFRCDVGDGIPLDFWCDLHDMTDKLTDSQSVLLCEGYTVCNQYKGFDADYGWFPGLSAQAVRNAWTAREKECPRGSKFVNHYENHDIATDVRPRREIKWGHAQIDQVLVWMFTIDGIPLLFDGNEIADSDERHSMFGKTPIDWSQIEREPGKSRHAFVKKLAAFRHEHAALTAVNGIDGLTWLDTTLPDKVTAFVRRGKDETLLVVQNWSGEEVCCNISFEVAQASVPSYMSIDAEDRNIKGTIADTPLLCHSAEKTGERSFRIGPWGYLVMEVFRNATEYYVPVHSFLKENTGKTIERLPNSVLPEIAFLALSGNDVEPVPGYCKVQDVVKNAVCGISPFNTVTLTLRRAGELTDSAVMRETAAIVANAHAHGVIVSMDIDHRIARTEFFRRWPGEAQQELDWGMFKPSNDGVASFQIEPEYRGDHMTGGTPGDLDYTARKAELAAAFAVKLNESGEVISASIRTVDVLLDGTVPAGTLAGTAKGLAADEVLLVCAKETLHFVDLFSPHLMPWHEELALRYKAIGVDCAMHDELGFPGIGGSDSDRMTRHLAYWYSPGFAAEYRRVSGGRDLLADSRLMAFPEEGRREETKKAIDAYFRVIFEKTAALEGEFYEMNKRIWGADAFVGKHPTFWSWMSPKEPVHDGFDWWRVKRDWVQTDENCEVAHCNAMVKKWGSPNWLNEGYRPRSTQYPFFTWRYAACGGRMVYHPVYDPGKNVEMQKYPKETWAYHRIADIVTCGGGTAQERIQLVNLITRSQIDCPAAMIFSHPRIMNWLETDGYLDDGKKLSDDLGYLGWYVDSYPSTELEVGTFVIDADGYLRVGAQQYRVLITYKLRDDERRRLDEFLQSGKCRTRVFDYSERDVVASVAAYLEDIGAVRQTPFAKDDGFWGTHLPAPDGVVTHLDGTVLRVKGCLPDPTGDPIAGELVSNGVKALYEACGFCAFRAENGDVAAFAAGGLRRFTAAGLDLAFDKPIDLVLMKIDGKWYGYCQGVSEMEIPQSLRQLVENRLIVNSRRAN